MQMNETDFTCSLSSCQNLSLFVKGHCSHKADAVPKDMFWLVCHRETERLRVKCLSEIKHISMHISCHNTSHCSHDVMILDRSVIRAEQLIEIVSKVQYRPIVKCHMQTLGAAVLKMCGKIPL